MRAWLRVARVPTEVLIPTFLTHLTSTCPNIPSSYHIKHKNMCNISHQTYHDTTVPGVIGTSATAMLASLFIQELRYFYPLKLLLIYRRGENIKWWWLGLWASGPLGLWVSGPMGLLVYWAYWASCATQASPIDMIVNERASLLRPNFPSSYFQLKTNLKWNFKSIVFDIFHKKWHFWNLVAKFHK